MLKEHCKYLYYHGIDIIKGDIISFDKSGFKSIYDGKQLHLYFLKNSNILPQEFDIINDGVPYNYWYIDKFKFKTI